MRRAGGVEFRQRTQPEQMLGGKKKKNYLLKEQEVDQSHWGVVSERSWAK